MTMLDGGVTGYRPVPVNDEEIGVESGLWLVTVSAWVKAPTAQEAATKARLHAEKHPDNWSDPMIDAVQGWNPAG